MLFKVTNNAKNNWHAFYFILFHFVFINSGDL